MTATTGIIAFSLEQNASLQYSNFKVSYIYDSLPSDGVLLL